MPRSEWPKNYVLLNRTPVAVDAETWAIWFGKNDRTVARTHLKDDCFVSTVFLGLDHNYAIDGEPLLFETLVFGGPLDGEMDRYSTWAEAERGHERMVNAVNKAYDKIASIAKSAGANCE